MRIKALALIVLIFIIAPEIARAAAVPVDLTCVYNFAGSQRGSRTRIAVNNYHPGEEYYLQSMRNERSGGQYATRFSWEIAERSEKPNEFHPFLHITYPIDSPYYSIYGPNGHQRWFDNLTISQNEFHLLNIAASTTQEGYWNVYLDGIFRGSFPWPYYTGTYSVTQIESQTGSPASYQGHHKDIYFANSLGNLILQDSSWYQYIATAASPSPYIFWPTFNINYYDWYGRRL